MVDTVEEAHEENLRVTLSTVTRLSLGLFRFLANLDDDDIGNNVAFKLVKAGVNLAVIKLLTAGANRFEGEGRRINLGVNSKNIENDLGRGTIVTLTNDDTITNNANKLALVIVLESCQRVQSVSKRVLALSVDGNLANDKFVLRGRASLGAELKSSKELDGSDDTDDDSKREEKIVVDLASSRITEIDNTLESNVLDTYPTVLEVGGNSLVLGVGNEIIKVLLDVGAGTVRPQIDHILVEELVRVEIVVDLKSVQVICQVINLVPVPSPHMLIVLTLALDLAGLPYEITMVVLLDLGLELLPVPIWILEGTGAITSIEARSMLSKRLCDGFVESELGGFLDTKASAGRVQRRHEVVVQHHTSEDNHTVDENDEEEKDELLTPGHANIGSSHTANELEKRRWNPESQSPDESNPGPTTECEWLSLDLLILGKIRIQHASELAILVVVNLALAVSRLDIKHALSLPPRTFSDPDSFFANEDFTVAPSSLQHPGLNTILAVLATEGSVSADELIDVEIGSVVEVSVAAVGPLRKSPGAKLSRDGAS
ncbi:hypothetical protein HG530_000011 [Fusarium avenaceum]|nr:hypothetical protein HG530_000011 [Fusarium avenaceum]